MIVGVPWIVDTEAFGLLAPETRLASRALDLQSPAGIAVWLRLLT